ncbi:MAG: hypothetical protein RTU63_04960 [Candidatus Thorarchaeota archaeon]
MEVDPLSGSETEEKNIPSHLQSAIKMVTTVYHEYSGITEGAEIPPEYACLRSMMLEPQNPTMWNSMALVYLMTGRIVDAQDAIERSLDIDSSLAWTWSIWGDLLLLRGNMQESERAYRMAVEMGSTDPHVLHQLVSLLADRGNHPEALRLLLQLIPQCPDDQSLWDLYTDCISRNKRLFQNNQ